MTLRRAQTIVVTLVFGWAVSACAPPYDPVAQPPVEGGSAGPAVSIETVRDNVTKVLTGVKRDSIHPAEAPGLYEIRAGSQFAYVTADGKYLIEGDLVDLISGVSLTENKRKGERVAKLAALGEENLIVFGPAQASDAGHTVTVFTDVDCGYCRKLHRQMAEYNARGIRVRYLYFPRSGPGTESWLKSEQVACAKDPRSALTKAKMGEVLKDKACKPNPVAEHYNTGRDFGLQGTPAIVLESGELIGGYLEPDELAKYLAEAKTAKVARQ